MIDDFLDDNKLVYPVEDEDKEEFNIYKPNLGKKLKSKSKSKSKSKNKR